MRSREHTILFIGDETAPKDLIRQAFDESGARARVEFIAAASAAAEIAMRESVDAIFFNRNMLGTKEFEILRNMNKERVRKIPFIMIGARADKESDLRAIRAGIDDAVADDPRAIAAFPVIAERAIARYEAVRLSAEQDRAILHSQKEWLSILDAITDYIFVVDENRRVIKANKAFAARFSAKPQEVSGKECAELFGADILNDISVTNAPDGGAPQIYEKTVAEETYQISIFPLLENDRTLTVHVMKNITELRRLKDQLHYADKLASIGLLVSGVAHEINNPLTGTIAYTELLSMKVTDEVVKKDLSKILESAERCKKIVDNLLTFSRQRTPSKSVESMNEIIDRAVDLRSYWLRSGNIEVIRDYDPVSTVFVDSQQIQQVMLNILLNAEQAISGSGQRQGKISFTTRYSKERRTVTIRIADNGAGIPPSILSRIFDPFFSTKPVGVGTGLGLSISHGIITEHGGTIRAENGEGGGALFTIELPTGGQPAS